MTHRQCTGICKAIIRNLDKSSEHIRNSHCTICKCSFTDIQRFCPCCQEELYKRDTSFESEIEEVIQ